MSFVFFTVGPLPSQPSFPFAVVAAIFLETKNEFNSFLKERFGM